MPDDGRKTEVIETTVGKLADTAADLARRGLAPNERIAVVPAEEYARLKRRDRRVGLTEELLPAEWIEAVRSAKVPDEFAALDGELNNACRCPHLFPVLSSATAASGTAIT